MDTNNSHHHEHTGSGGHPASFQLVTRDKAVDK
jgi:hypothetical protein